MSVMEKLLKEVINNPKVSILIPVYNGANYLAEAIESALSQTYKNIEIIVVNDGSNDNYATREIAELYGNKIRYFEKENGGTSSALNYGIRKMKGDYFAWLSHDDVYFPERIEKHIKAIQETGDETTPVHSPSFLWIDSKDLYDPNKTYSYDKKFYEDCFTALSLGLVNGLSLTIHKSYFEKYGLFDEELKTTQDYMKWFEMFHDRKLLFLEEHLVKNRIHKEQQGKRIPDIWVRETDELFDKMLEVVTNEEVFYSGLDLYTFLGLAIIRFESIGAFSAAKHAESLILNEKEPEFSESQRQALKNYFNNSEIYLYCFGRRGKALIKGLFLRGINVTAYSDQQIVKNEPEFYGAQGIPKANIPKDVKLIIGKEHPQELKKLFINEGYLDVTTYDEIINVIMHTPIDKSKLVD